jgi:hypothetical protein
MLKLDRPFSFDANYFFKSHARVKKPGELSARCSWYGKGRFLLAGIFTAPFCRSRANNSVGQILRLISRLVWLLSDFKTKAAAKVTDCAKNFSLMAC